VGTFEIAEAFGSNKMITCMHKHYTVDEWVRWGEAHPDLLDFVAVSSGTSNEDFTKMSAILEKVNVGFICLDVANGYSEHVCGPASAATSII
jgi:GMP reductase